MQVKLIKREAGEKRTELTVCTKTSVRALPTVCVYLISNKNKQLGPPQTNLSN